jgi:hypothetical protein
MDQHLVIEARQDADGTWQYRAVTPALSWSDAQAEWDRLDGTRRGREGIHSMAPASHHFMVRSEDDPRWCHLSRPQVFRKGATKATERAARKHARAHGVVGNSGGWLYRVNTAGERSRRPIGQGWYVYARQLQSRGIIRPVPGTDGADVMLVLEDLTNWDTDPVADEIARVTRGGVRDTVAS